MLRAAAKGFRADPTVPGRGRPVPPGRSVTGRPGPDLVSRDPAWHVLRRCTYGPTPDSLAEIRTIGVDAWFARQLAPASIDDSACDRIVARFPRLRMDSATLRAGALEQYSWDVMYELGQATIARAAWSRRQVFEIMVDFWSNHLNVTNPFEGAWDTRHLYDRDVIRRHTFGRFADMLKAAARHPSMLGYLDNQSSTSEHPNENYARELMELHTVGVDAGYTEEEVRAAARLLTGLSIDWDTGLYRYDPEIHATGPVSVLGFTHPNGDPDGEAVAMAFLDHLALHPATARHIAVKLCLRFVADEPPPALVARLATVYLRNRSAIVPVLAELFASPEFRGAAGAKVRRPMQDIVATVRALGLGPDVRGTQGLENLYWMVDGTGDAPMGWHPPNGYPDVAVAWASAAGTLARWNAHLSLAANWWPDSLTRPADLRKYLVPVLPRTYGALVDALALRLGGVTMRPAHTAGITRYLDRTPSSRLYADDDALGWRFPYLVALVLDSPYFSFR